jgi:hypothetical protein
MRTLLVGVLFLGGCLQYAYSDGPAPSSAPDMAMAPSVPGPAPGPAANAYFNPDIQNDLDTLGCTGAGACHGGNGSPAITKMPTTLAAWQQNYEDIHIDCSTGDCLGGGATSLLLTKPLQGGPAHTGTKPFASTSDPIYQRWLTWIAAGAPYDAANSLGAADMSTPGATDMGSASDMASKEKLTITFTTSKSPTPSGFQPKNVVAVWIENAGTFVKTAGRWANVRRSHLIAWEGEAGSMDVDSISGASQQNYGTLTATWDMTARAGLATPVDGTYTIRLELADGDSNTATQNNQGTFTFNRNGTASTQSALSNGGFSNVSIVYSGR